MKKTHKLLLLVFIAVFLFRLYFVFKTQNFSSDEAYYNLRHILYIKENTTPLVYDTLSYGGRFVLDLHIWHYILALFSLLSIYALKIVPALLDASIVILVFIFAYKLTNNQNASLFSAVISGFIPVQISTTLNQISIYSLIIVFVLLLLIFMLDIKKYIGWFILFSFLLLLTQPLHLVLPLAFLFYLALSSLEVQETETLVKESIVFFVFLALLINLIIFKKPFFDTGIYAVYKNIPEALLANYFRDINLVDILYGIGVVPLIIGAIGLSIAIGKEKGRAALLISAVIFADFCLLLLKLIPFHVGILYLGVMFAITSSVVYSNITKYLEMTKFNRYKSQILGVGCIIVFLSVIIPSAVIANSVIENGVSEYEIEAMVWLANNTKEDAVIAGDVFEGNLIATIAKRTNVIDTNFIFAEDRYEDIKTLYTTEYLIKAMRVVGKYKIDYVYVSDKTKERYGITKLKYADTECFKEVFANEKASIYEILC